MARWRGRKSFEGDLFASYKSAGLQFGKIGVPMGAALFESQAAIPVGKLPKKVADGLSVIDDLLLDAIIWYHTVAMMIWEKEPSSNDFFHRAIMALFMRVAQDAVAVRNLIHTGFDVQAKNILRSLDEHVDAICLLCIRPSLCEQFVRTNDEKRANSFYHGHLRSARKVINQKLIEMVKENAALQDLVEFRRSERLMLSTAHHPSYVACTMPFMSPYRSANVTRYLFGLPTEYSFRTGKVLFYILVMTAMISCS